MKNVKGFTLIELLVVIAIVVLMTIAVFSNYGKNSEMFALERSAQKLAQDFRRTQEMAISGMGFSADSDICGYGLYFNKNSVATPSTKLKYIIYEEIDNDCINVTRSWQNGTDIIKETIDIEKGIEIYDILDRNIATGITSSVSTRSISFKPPVPLTIISNFSSGHEVSIILRITSDTAKTRTVKINNAGRVEVTNP